MTNERTVGINGNSYEHDELQLSTNHHHQSQVSPDIATQWIVVKMTVELNMKEIHTVTSMYSSFMTG
jgi:hypothetical protein